MHTYDVGDTIRLVKFVDSVVMGTAAESHEAYGDYIGQIGVVRAVYSRNASLEVYFPGTETLASDSLDVLPEEVELIND